MRQVEANGLTFDVIVDGPDGGEPVLLLHGFPANNTSWAAVTSRLAAAGRRTYAPNQRGYSPGARPAGVPAYAMANVVADTVGMLDALGLSTVDLVGHDWGALAAWQTAARHPDRVRSLTAVSVPHPIAFAWARQSDADQQRRSGYIDLFVQAGKAEQVLLADDARRLRGMLAPLPAEAVESYTSLLTQPDALTGALNWYRAISAADLAGLGAVTVPTTFLWGPEDLAVGRAAAEKCADYVSGPYAFVELPGIGHWAPETAPDAVADAVLKPPA
jgi:pimeloyl-ACP methyl ester carboxylesterase